MKTKEAVDLYMGLGNLIHNRDRVYPGKIGYAINRNFRKLTPIVEDYENTRVALIKSVGEPGEEEGTYIIADEGKRQELSKQLDALLEIDNDDIKLTMLKFSDIESVDFSIEEMDALYPMISEED